MFCTIIYFVLTIRERFDMYNKRWANLKRRFILSEVATNVNSQQTKVKYGFTLPEVFITLRIIGVVATMKIPNLIATHQKKQTVVKLQKAISVMNQAYRLAYDDVGEVTAEEARTLGAQNYFDKFWAPYIKVQSLCSVEGCGYGAYPQWKMTNGSPYGLAVHTSDARVAFTSMDGFFYIVVTYTGGIDDSTVSVNSV